MKLFDGFEAVRFSEENMIFVTHDTFLYYIYNPKYESWRKYKNAGNDCISVCNYQEVSKEEIIAATGGLFPQKETDFMRLCDPEQLCIGEIMDLLEEDFPYYMSEGTIWRSVRDFLYKSAIRSKSYLYLRKLFEGSASQSTDRAQVLNQIKALAFSVIGKDIFGDEIEIVDGHDGSSYFWIMPVRVIDPTDTNDWDAVAEMRSVEISIEEDNVSQFLSPFLLKHFDDTLDANRKRIKYRWTDDNGNEQIESTHGFEWYLTHNYYTFDSIQNVIKEIRDTTDALSSGTENAVTKRIMNRQTGDGPEPDLVIDFYRRFIYRMEYMMTVGKENGYDLISFMGP